MTHESQKECPSCAMMIDKSARVCPICQYEFSSQGPYIQVVAILLIMLFLYFFIF